MTETFAIALAKAHLETEMSDFIILGFNRKDPEPKIKTTYQAQDKESLIFLFAELNKQLSELSNESGN